MLRNFRLILSVTTAILLLASVSHGQAQSIGTVTSVPIHFRGSWKLSSVDFIAWTADETSIIVEAAYCYFVFNTAGKMLKYGNLPSSDAKLIDDNYAVITYDPDQDYAFAVTKLGSRNVIYGKKRPPTVSPETIGTYISPDGQRLALSYGYPTTSQPISIFDTRSWQKVAEIVDFMSYLIGPTFFSNDDSAIAIQTQRGISVFDLRKKTPVRTICCDIGTAALGPDGSLLAAIEPPKHLNPGPLKIFRVADGVVVASHQFATNDSTCRGDGDLCNELVNVVWDPQGRYLVSLETNTRATYR